jgi:hypothetical protein
MPKSKPSKSSQVISLFSEIEQYDINSSIVSSAKGYSVDRRQSNFTSTKDLLSKYQVGEQNKHISYEFQSFGCHLAEVLADKRHTSLYIKLAKTEHRGLLERALSFVIDSSADNKAKLFMWKLGQLKQDNKNKL